jgi:hypothetical protein
MCRALRSYMTESGPPEDPARPETAALATLAMFLFVWYHLLLYGESNFVLVNSFRATAVNLEWMLSGEPGVEWTVGFIW